MLIIDGSVHSKGESYLNTVLKAVELKQKPLVSYASSYPLW